MPLSKYNAQFGGKKGSAAKAKRAMAKQYGEKKGEQVFYALKNKRAGQKREGPQSRSDRERLSEAFRKRGKKKRTRRA